MITTNKLTNNRVITEMHMSSAKVVAATVMANAHIAIYKQDTPLLMHSLGVWWCAAQLPCILFVCSTWNTPVSNIYYVNFHNGTLTVAPNEMELYPGYMGTSIAVVVFAMITLQMHQKEVFDNMTEFSNSVIETYAFWNLLFWLVFLTWHTLMTVQLASPIDLYCVLFVTIGQYVTINTLCKPREMYRGYENLALLAYLVLDLMVLNAMHSHHGLKIFVFCCSVTVDLLLITGHTYDPSLNNETMGNCRVFYACAVSILMFFMYWAV